MKRSRVSPRVRLAWKATPALGLSLSAGSGFSVPRPIFERVCCGASFLPNVNVRAETSENLLLDIDYVPRPWLKIRGAAFRNDVEDYLQKVILFSFSNYIPMYTNANYQDVRIEGYELSLEMRFLRRLSYGATYTHLDPLLEKEAPVSLLGLGDVFEVPAGQLPYVAPDTASAFIRWDDQEAGLKLSAEAQYSGSMLIQKITDFFGPVGTFEETRAFRVYNARAEKRVVGGLSVFLGVDNITGEYEDWLDDPRREFNWGPLRERYVYGGLSYEM